MANETNQHETNLRTALRSIDPERYADICRAYYQAADALRSLADALEEQAADDNDALLREHFQVGAALDALNRTSLGKVV